MWSGWLLTNKSGSITGAHQRIDRVSLRKLTNLVGEGAFPEVKHILHFEGKNGPDGIKAKSPANDEPWHYYDPFDPDDSMIIGLVEGHYKKLVDALKKKDKHKIAFEAAWMAHALVDGLTPAHHFPYEQELEKLRGEPKETRTTILKKWIIPGETKLKMLVNNWKMWGAKGLFLSHGMYELGVAFILLFMRFHLCEITDYDLKNFHKLGLTEYFKQKAREVALMDMYASYYKHGWTSKLAHQTRDELVPILIKTVTLAWYSAMYDAKLVKAPVKF